MKIKNPFLLKIGGFLVFAFSRMWMSLVRKRAWYPDIHLDPVVQDPDPEHPRRRIYLFWHEYILFPFYLRGGCNLTMLLSQHADATMLYYAAKLAGFGVVRGSSRRGAAGALKEMMEVSKKREHLTLTPDGPRGPRRTMAPGAVFLASQLQMPIILIGFGYDRPYRFNSWDRFALPRLFSRVRMVFSEEIMIPPDLTKEQIEEYQHMLEKRLNELTEDAERWAESGEKREGEVVCFRGKYGSVKCK